MSKARYEKVDETQMKITKEVSQVIDVVKLVLAKEQLEKRVVKMREEVEGEITQIEEQIKAITEAIAEAEKLGIDISQKPGQVKDESENN